MNTINTKKIFVALDNSDAAATFALAQRLAPHIGGLKLGLEFFSRHGLAGLEPFTTLGVPLFLDLKFHDIPNTVAAAVRNVAGSGARFLTVHASGGGAMLKAAVEAAGGNLGILAVTVLTSLEANPEEVLRLAKLAQASGCAGVICSPWEVAAIKAACGPAFVCITPGIRPAGSPAGDQQRTATPEQALAQGADYLVVGRPITGAADPVGAAVNLFKVSLP